jgi:hypothetical protein
MMLVRSLDWRDLAQLHRIRKDGICLDSQMALTRGPQAMQNALLDVFLPGNRAVCTAVLRTGGAREVAGIGQFILCNDRHQAHLAYISPAEILAADDGLYLLDGIARLAGERGAQTLVAEVGETDSSFETLRRAGFAIYARQRIWRLEGAASTSVPARRDDWRPASGRDRLAVQTLYINIVPALVQQVEPPPLENNQGLIFQAGTETLGFLDIQHGANGIWIQPYFHPAAELTDELLAGFIQSLGAHDDKPLYVCVRSYQGGLGGSLERLGLQPFTDQAVMVKRLTAVVRRALEQALPALDGTQPEPTAPITSLEHKESLSQPTQP